MMSDVSSFWKFVAAGMSQGDLRMGRGSALAVIALLVIPVACGTKPIPMIAVAGTTVTIPIPDGFPTGFGRVVAGSSAADPLSSVPAFSAASPLEDPQRGELLFSLLDSNGTHLRYLPVAYITRVHMSPQSRSATAGC